MQRLIVPTAVIVCRARAFSLMLSTLLALCFRLLTGISLDYLWAGCIIKDVVPPFLLPRWSIRWDFTCHSLRAFAMHLLRVIDLVCTLILTVFSPPSIAGNANLPSYPLAVKCPYLSAWVPGDQILISAATAQPQFWTGSPLTWPVLARVDNVTYSLFGNPNGTYNASSATTDSVSYTSSHTHVCLTAGRATFVLDFFFTHFASEG